MQLFQKHMDKILRKFQLKFKKKIQKAAKDTVIFHKFAETNNIVC